MKSNDDHWINPAIDPTRKWKDSPEARANIRMILKKLTESDISYLRDLLDNNYHELTTDHENAVLFINQSSEAFGFVAMLTYGNSSTIRLTKGVKSPLAAVMAEDPASW